jgi:carboxypeptidase C (cathepsin A)
MKHKKVIILFITLFLVISGSVGAEHKGEHKKSSPVPPVDEAKLSKLSITRHSIKTGKKVLNYTATAGNFLMKDEKSGKLRATIFFMAYHLDKGAGNAEPGKRPVTFVFNGGPGSASLWLHMGALGPKRVKMSEEGFILPQPFEYIDNQGTWLGFTDLVFIDPVSTGYSRPAPEEKHEAFHGVRQDIRAVGDFIRLYVTRNGRWLSPKYLCGESYGTTRAAGLSGYLQDEYGMYLQGIVLVSSIMNFQTARFIPGNDLPYPLFLPTFTAAARYHKKLPAKYMKDLKTTLAEVEQWALNGYTVALAKGNKLSREERNEVIDKLAQYTGLSKSYIDQADLRIDMRRFTRGLLRDEKKTVGRLDSRFFSKELDAFSGGLADDPSYAAILGPYAAVVNHYIRTDLKYVNDAPYRPIAREAWPWDWGEGNRFVNVAQTLKTAMLNNNNLKVMIANGYYDLATPYFATDYTVSHMGLPPSLAKNIVMKYYEAGHMMYIKESCLIELKEDAAEFYQGK